jgi:predicted transcriptional regulator of viral defense system
MTEGDQKTAPRFRVGPQEFGLLAQLRRLGKSTLVLPDDRDLVAAFSTRPSRLLSRMAAKGLLRRVSRGHYLVLGPGAGRAEDEVPRLAVLAAALASSRYAISFLSALTYYGLTDHESYDVTLLLDLGRGATAPRRIAGVPVRVRVERRDWRWFGVRTAEDRFGTFRITDPERAIIDSVDRPTFAAGPETVVRSLSRGLLNGTLRVSRLVRYSERHSVRVARRVGYLLETLDVAGVEQLQPLRDRSKQSRRTDRLFGVAADADDVDRISAWRLETEVPTSVIRAWAAYEEAA